MSNFAGWEKPIKNFVQVPHAFWKIDDLTAHEKIVLLYILRHTWGFQEYDIMKRITIDEFQHGRKFANGEREDKGCGMSRGGVHKSLQVLEAKGYIVTETDATDTARIKKFYMLNMQENSVHDTNAEFTERTQSSQGRKRTEKETKERNSTKKIKEKDSSALHSKDAPSDVDGDLLQDEPVAETPIAEELEAPSIQAEELPIVTENTQAAAEESASQLESPESFEIVPVRELDPDPIAPEKTPDADVAAVIDEAEELVRANKIALDNCYNEIVRRAFAPIGKPLNFSGVVTNHSKFLRGLFAEGEEGSGPERLKYQLTERPMSPAEIAGMTIWFRQECKQEKLPKTCSTLRERCDEFRALYDYEQWAMKGQKVVDQLMAGIDIKLETKPASRVANAQKPPDESDMEPFDLAAEERKYQESIRGQQKSNVPA